MILYALLLACSPDACDAMCDAALVRYEACLAEWGLEWGASVGYADASDYRNWCDTWSWEARQLGEADQCEEVRTALLEGTCDDYPDAWSEP